MWCIVVGVGFVHFIEKKKPDYCALDITAKWLSFKVLYLYELSANLKHSV